LSFEDSLELVKLSFKKQNSEVLAVSTKLTVIDPLKLSRIIAPGRSSTCKHIQCFDLENYLLMNERIRRWLCPICNKSAFYPDLIHDGYFAKILEEISDKPEVTGVEIQPDGKWSVDHSKGKDPHSKNSQTEEESSHSKGKNSVKDIIELTDSDNELDPYLAVVDLDDEIGEILDVDDNTSTSSSSSTNNSSTNSDLTFTTTTTTTTTPSREACLSPIVLRAPLRTISPNTPRETRVVVLLDSDDE